MAAAARPKAGPQRRGHRGTLVPLLELQKVKELVNVSRHFISNIRKVIVKIQRKNIRIKLRKVTNKIRLRKI